MSQQKGYSHGEAAPELLHYISIKLKPGWRFDRRHAQFVAADGQRLAVRDQLPPGSRIVPTVAALAEADPEQLSVAERDLARHFQLIPLKGTKLEKMLRAVKRWDAVEEATLPPQVSLP